MQSIRVGFKYKNCEQLEKDGNYQVVFTCFSAAWKKTGPVLCWALIILLTSLSCYLFIAEVNKYLKLLLIPVPFILFALLDRIYSKVELEQRGIAFSVREYNFLGQHSKKT